MSRGPLPSHLCLLSALPEHQRGTKVRFLGCVTAYDTSTACLTLGHAYPSDSKVEAVVDLGMVLSSVTSETVRIGEWLNVIGYVTSHKHQEVNLQAILLWPTGPLNVQDYERARAGEGHTVP